jgi:hypothetical protein
VTRNRHRDTLADARLHHVAHCASTKVTLELPRTPGLLTRPLPQAAYVPARLSPAPSPGEREHIGNHPVQFPLRGQRPRALHDQTGLQV